MRLAYGDPPYLGQAKRHYAHDPSGIEAAEVDFHALIAQLRTYDGWAMSASSPSLGHMLSLAPEARLAAWVKPFCSWKPSHRVQYAWEPVLFVAARPRGTKDRPSVRDYVVANITTRRGTHGAKPDVFCDWIIDLLGAEPDDEFDDLFPGSGVVGQAWERFVSHGTDGVTPETTDSQAPVGDRETRRPRPPAPCPSKERTMVMLRLDDIADQQGINIREKLDQALIEHYAEILDLLPPIVVFGDENFLGDGFHRVAAAHTIGRIEIAAEQKPGTRADAEDYAVTANARRGLNLKASERSAGIRRLLSHGWTQEKIAGAIGVDQSTITNIHNALALRGEQPKQASRPGVGHRPQTQVAALPPQIAEKIGDTQLYQIAGLSTDAERLAVAQIVADEELSVVETVATVQTVKRDGLGAGLVQAQNIAVARKIKQGMKAAVDADAMVAISGALLGLLTLRSGFSPEEAAAGVMIESRDYYIGEFTKAAEWMVDFVAVLSDRRLKAV